MFSHCTTVESKQLNFSFFSCCQNQIYGFRCLLASVWTFQLPCEEVKTYSGAEASYHMHVVVTSFLNIASHWQQNEGK